MTKRSHGDGGIDRRGENVYRLRPRANGKRTSVTFHGTLTEARKEMRRLQKAVDDGTHVDPSKKRLGNGSRNGSQPVRRAARSGGSDSNRWNDTRKFSTSTSSRRSERSRCRSSPPA